MTKALAAAGVSRPDAAAEHLWRFAAARPAPQVLVECSRAFAAALVDTPVPEKSLANFLRLLENAHDPDGWANFLLNHQRALEIVVKLFVGSQHLTDLLIRQPEMLLELTAKKQLADVKSRQEFLEEARRAADGKPTPEQKFRALRRYQLQESLRISAADTFSLLDLKATTGQLSRLAEAVLQVCLDITAEQLQQDPACLSVLAFGKLGGGELNYSSDIDLVLLSDDPRPAVMTLAQQLLKVLSESTAEGFFYRVDLRLRPWGTAGPLVTTPDAYREYLHRHASFWERQALVKARVVAGSFPIGQAFLKSISPWIFRHDDSAVLRAGIRQAKRRIEDEARRQGHPWGDVKSGRGSLRDIEFVTQFLQLHFGASLPAVRSPNTLDALVRLADFDGLAPGEYRQLTDGYVFLRTIEHALQLMHNQQRHALPTDPGELNYLARRLDYPGAEALVAQYERHVEAIRAIYERYLEQAHPAALMSPGVSPASGENELPCYEGTFSESDRAEHRRMMRQTSPEQPVRLTSRAADGVWQVTIVGDDRPGDLSMTCGLFFVYGFDILEGDMFTIESDQPSESSAGSRSMFACRFVARSAEQRPETWPEFESDLNDLFRLARTGVTGAAQGKLAKRVATALSGHGGTSSRLLPMQVDFDSDVSDSATMLRLQAEDSPGFLYELTNALAFCDIDIKAMSVRTRGARVDDTLLVADARRGGKIASEQRLKELNAAIVLIKQFTHLVPQAPNPEAALLHFRSLIAELFQQPNWVEEFASLERPDVLDALSRMLGVSDFLWEDMLRLQHANLFPMFKDLSTLDSPRSRAELERDLESELSRAAQRAERVQALNAFKDREMFRIDMRHILGKIPEFRQFSAELSDLAEVVVRSACVLNWSELSAEFGLPRTPQGEPCQYVVAALGKYGGRELGFASDIELLVIYEEEGETSGATPIANADFFRQFVERLTASIQARQEGIFHIDLRLRPYGRHGRLASSRTAFQEYFHPQGPAWPFERQALVKLRPVAGDELLGWELVALRDVCIYTGQPVDHLAMQALRERQVRQLVQAGTFHAKLSPGALVDIEYLIQWLQLRHGHTSASLRTPATADAAAALRDAGILAANDHAQLESAYWFFRRLIDALRMVRGNAQDLTVPPHGSEEFEFLARRLNYGGESARLQHEIEFHQQTVLGIVRRCRLEA